MVDRGAYDDDLDKIIDHHCDDIGDSIPAVDSFLAETSAFVSDALAAVRHPANSAESKSDAAFDISSDDAAAKFVEDLDHDVEALLSTRSDRVSASEELQQMQKAFEADLQEPMAVAHAGLVENFVPMLPFRADEQILLKNLLQDVEDRIARVAELAKCGAGDVLRVAFFDLPVPLVLLRLCVYATRLPYVVLVPLASDECGDFGCGEFSSLLLSWTRAGISSGRPLEPRALPLWISAVAYARPLPARLG